MKRVIFQGALVSSSILFDAAQVVLAFYTNSFLESSLYVFENYCKLQYGVIWHDSTFSIPFGLKHRQPRLHEETPVVAEW